MTLMKLLIPLFLTIPLLAQGILDLDHSPHAALHTVPVRAVHMRDGFWTSRMRINVDKSIPTMLDELEQHGIVDNFRKGVTRRGPLYTDSDIYKWIEAAAFVLQSEKHPELVAKIDSLTDVILAAQEPSGYLNTYWSGERASQRFTQQTRGHELYCLGHLLQGAIAYYRATGNRKLLDGGIKFADYMVDNFGPQKRPALTGHPELEMALVELARTTGNRKYVEFAGYLLSGVERERLHLTDADLRYMFSGKPFTSRTIFEGHAVRALYAASGATDYYIETGDPAYAKTLETLWTDLVSHKMYITGGVGSRASGEAIGEAYELPNAQAYGESCAAIANLMFNWRMLMARGESRFVDVMERALYNGINSGMSLSGTLYCYRNPLESNGEKIRNEWYDTTCCPPNIERTFAALPGYLYATGPRGVYVNLFHSSVMDWHLEDGTPVKIEQSTKYPWEGAAEFTVSPAKETEFSLFLRIPGWSGARAMVNGKPAPAGQYYEIRRRWNAGDKVQLALDVNPRIVHANPLVRENAGRVAVERGPLIYCIEQPDQSGNLFDASLTEGKFTSQYRADKLDGIIELKHAGRITEKPLSDEPLYQALPQARREAPLDLTLIPYYTWANRGPAAMEVWIPWGRL